MIGEIVLTHRVAMCRDCKRSIPKELKRYQEHGWYGTYPTSSSYCIPCAIKRLKKKRRESEKEMCKCDKEIKTIDLKKYNSLMKDSEIIDKL